jgi:hypothetical protein
MKQQFTAYDRELYPEYDNSEYLDHEKVSTGLSSDICSYGYRINNKWVKKSDYKRRNHERQT